MRKYIVTLFIALSACLSLHAQSSIKAVIKDIQTNQPIPKAVVIAGNKTIIASDNGEFELNKNITDIKITSVGYINKEISINKNETNLLILLEPDNISLTEVMVEGNSLQHKILNAPEAIGLLTSKDMQRTNGIQLHQSLNLLSGVKMEMRNANSGARIVLRGYGNETNFNGNGYKAYLNGMPITDADGTTFLDDIDFTNLGRVEITKGPNSSLYGNSIGGVVLMQMQKAKAGETWLHQGLLAGSDGLLRTNSSYLTGSANSNLFVNYGHQQYDNFRMHGSSKKDFINLGADFYVSPKRTVSVFGSYTNSFDYLPGQVDSINLYNHPDSSSADYVANDAHVATENIKLTVSQEYHFNQNFSNTTGVFFAGTYIDQPSAAGLSRTLKAKFGGRSVFSYAVKAGTIPLKFSFGTEFIKNKNFAKSYTLVNNVLGAMKADQEIDATQANLFIQADAQVSPTTTISVAAGENYLSYSIADLIAVSASHKYTGGFKRFNPILAPKFSIDQMVAKNIAVYLSISKGFSSPSTSQVITPKPEINLDLTPEVATNFQIGSKGSIGNKELSYDVCIFWMNVKDKLVSEYLNGNSYQTTTNAGDAKHKGLELMLSYAKQFSAAHFIALIKPFISYTYSDFTYGDYATIPADPAQQINNISGQPAKVVNLSGKQISGTAKNLFNAGLDIETHSGLYLNTTFMFVDKMPVDYNNLHFAKAYSLLNTKLGYRKQLGNHFALDINGGLDNITSTAYATHIFLNSRDYPKIYNPMPNKITWYTGLSLKYIL
jgi:iron complex outermembrane receptor protein